MATQLKPFLTDIANAIRTKKGTTDTINAQNFASEITNLPTGSDIQELTEVPTEVDENSPDKIVVNGFLYEKISGGALGVWVWSDNLAGAGYGAESYNINFISNGETFTLLDKKTYAGYIPLYYDTAFVKSRSGWSNEAYKTIQITSGVDFENEKLLTLLNTAAQRQSEGYGYQKVVIDEQLDITANGTYETLENIRYNPINVNVVNPLQALVTGRGAEGGYNLCSYYKGDNVDFLADIDFSVATTMNNMFYKSTSLTTIPQLDTSNITNMTSMFYDCTSLTTVPLLDTSSATNMNSMFYGCSNLTTISQLNTSKVTNMTNMFYLCKKLTTIPLLNTIKVTNMNSMFYNCAELTTIPQLDTSSVTNMERMFQYCKKLTTIPLLNTIKVTNMNSMFYLCERLTTIDIMRFNPSSAYNGSDFAATCYSLTKFIIRTMDTIPVFGTNMFTGCHHFLGTHHDTYNPDGLKDGRIYVPDAQVDALKAATGWADFADIIVPLSTLVE